MRNFGSMKFLLVALALLPAAGCVSAGKPSLSTNSAGHHSTAEGPAFADNGLACPCRGAAGACTVENATYETGSRAAKCLDDPNGRKFETAPAKPHVAETELEDDPFSP